MNSKLLPLAVLAGLAAAPPASVIRFVPPASAACDAGEKPDKTTVEDTRKILGQAGFKKAHAWRKGCDNVWHAVATKDGAEVTVAVLPDGHIVREGD